MNPFLPALFPALGLSADTRIDVVGDGDLPSAFLVTDLAAASFGVAGAAVAAYANPDAPKPVQIDRRLASFWYQTSFQPRGWELPPTWDSVAGDYRTADGWIRLHTNANAHRAAAAYARAFVMGDACGPLANAALTNLAAAAARLFCVSPRSINSASRISNARSTKASGSSEGPGILIPSD